MFFFKLYNEVEQFILNVLLVRGIFYFPAKELGKITGIKSIQMYERMNTVRLRDLVEVDPERCEIPQNAVMLTLNQVMNILGHLASRNMEEDERRMLGNSRLKKFIVWFLRITFNFSADSLSVVHGNMLVAARSPYHSCMDPPVLTWDSNGGWSLAKLKRMWMAGNPGILDDSVKTFQSSWIRSKFTFPNSDRVISKHFAFLKCYKCETWNFTHPL